VPGEGRHQVLFSFDMPYDDSLAISQPFELPVQSLVVLSPDIGVTVTGQGLESDGVQDVQGVPYGMFSGGDIPAEVPLSLTLSGKPDLGGTAVIAPGSSTNLAVGLGVLGGALLGVGVWLFRRNSQRAAPEDEMDEADEDPSEVSTHGMDAESLMDAIIALDDHFKAGGLPEDAYLRRREVLKERLRKELE
jgi:hypothetical protein